MAKLKMDFLEKIYQEETIEARKYIYIATELYIYQIPKFLCIKTGQNWNPAYDDPSFNAQFIIAVILPDYTIARIKRGG